MSARNKFVIISLSNKGYSKQREVWALVSENHSSARSFLQAQMLARYNLYAVYMDFGGVAAPCPL